MNKWRLWVCGLFFLGLLQPGLAQNDNDRWTNDIQRMIDWYSYSLNILGSDSAYTSDKETIARESYLRVFRDAKVLIEDDLIENRREVTNKEVQAYLRDVDFFFKRVKFQHVLVRSERKINQLGRPYFLVETQRTLTAIDLDGRPIENRQTRFFEIELDEQRQVLYIVSIYTSRKGLEEDLLQWWTTLSFPWKRFVSASISLPNNTGFLSDILAFDSLAAVGNRYTVSGESIAIEPKWLAEQLLQVLATDSLDLSYAPWLNDLGPLAQFGQLKWLALRGTKVDDLTALRNLNQLLYLDVSHTPVLDLSPLRFLDGLQSIQLRRTLISDANEINRLVGLKFADLTGCPIVDIANIQLSGNLQHLILDSTQVADVQPLAGFPNLSVLSLNNCPISDVRPLASLPALSRIYLETTPVGSIMPLAPSKNLVYVFCDGSALTQKEAQAFRQAAPHITLVFGTADIKRWWKGLPSKLKLILDEGAKGWTPGSKEFFQALIRLDSLSYSHTDTLDLALLKPVSELRYLILSGTPLKNVEVISGFKKLEYLEVNSTGMDNLNWISGLARLRVLRAENNSIADASPMLGLNNLGKVYLDGNPLAYSKTLDLAFAHPEWNFIWHSDWLQQQWDALDSNWKSVMLAGNPELPGKLALHQLEQATRLQKPVQSGLKGPGPAVFMPFLEELILPESGLNDLAFVASLRRLKRLDVSGNPLVSLLDLQGLVELEAVNASATLIAKLQVLPSLERLRRLELASCPLENLEGIERYTDLRHLDVSGTRVKRLKPAEKLMELRTLKIFNTRISAKEAAGFKRLHPECEVIHY